MPRIDELLHDEGERWRAEVDARGRAAARASSRAADPRSTHRRVLAWSASLAGAAATVTLLSALITHGAGNDENSGGDFSRADKAGGGVAAAAAPSAAVSLAGGSSSARSCIAASLRLVDPPLGADPPVARGAVVVVRGVGELTAGCADTTPAGAAPTPARPAVVDVRLTTADHDAITVARAQPDSNGTFTARVRIPADAAVGPATITDGRGHRLRLTVVAH